MISKQTGTVALQLTFGSINQFYVVASGSKRPNLNVGDFIITRYSNNINDPAFFNNLRVGDIIVLRSLGINVGGQHIAIVQSYTDSDVNKEKRR